MRRNRISEMAEKVRLSESTKRRLKAELHQAKSSNGDEPVRGGIKLGGRVAVAAALVVSLSVSAVAVAHFGGLTLKKEGSQVQIEATGYENDTSTHYAWNASDDEISVRLAFEYMPSDMREDGTATHKYGSDTDNSRGITFSGHDLTREDLSVFLQKIDRAESFDAGGREAYLLTSESDILLYNKDIYVLFADLGLVVRGKAAFGVTDEELKSIAAGMNVYTTEDVTIALPISNELSGTTGTGDVINNSRWEIFRDDLYSLGESAVYDGYFETWEVTVEDAVIYDNISILKYELIEDYGREKIEKFTDENGNFVPYIRTKVDFDNGVFGESATAEKRLVMVTISLTDHENVEATAHSWMLYGLEEDGDTGKIKPMIEGGEYVIDSTPGKLAHSHEPIYKEDLGDGRWVIGYFLDTEECEGEMLLSCYHADIDYALTAK